MQTSRLLFLLLTVPVQAATGSPTREKYASSGDVNVVAHGLLQLGQGLREHVEKTKSHMRDVNAKLRALNGTVAELEKRHKGGEAEVENIEKLAEEQLDEVRSRVEKMRAENETIHSRVDRLEQRVDAALGAARPGRHDQVPFIQRILEAQSKRIDDLMEKIQQQQDKLDKQSLYLQALNSKVTTKRVKSHQRIDGETAMKADPAQSNIPEGLPRDCQDLFVQGQRASGVYTIQPQDSAPFNVFCEMTSGVGWTVIQKRHDGSQNFDQLWEDYKKGFGHLDGEFWLGLENIHSLSRQGLNMLEVVLSDWIGQEQSGRYQFRLDGEERNYALHVEHSSSDALEGIMTPATSGIPFSTSDRDNDLSAEVQCAKLLSGGWWFSSCGEANLNGRYGRRPNLHKGQQSRRQGMFWTPANGQSNSLKITIMKIAPAVIKQ
ncbi:angiopoietin-related protein 4-like [Lampris incognitus]|uniref:angiopoietin-related protein 4-like n=1 Tax=Lampris incognitus TaxID=2546036 RepID=UPI0024B551A7|nr:angiopoietin-related protein 4-like [Lampris incognitus]